MCKNVALGLALCAAPAWAQTPVAELAKPPADARRFVIVSTAGKHGEGSVWTSADGAHMGRMSMLLRGQVWEEDETTRFGPDNLIAHYELRGTSPQGDVAERFDVAGGKAVWKSQVDGGSAAYATPAFYLPAGLSIANGQQMIERLIAAPDHSLALLPGGRAHAERLATATIGEGASRKSLVAWAVTGISNSPFPVWATEDGRFFASIGTLSFVPKGYEAAPPVLEKVQDDALAARSPALVRKLLKTPAGPVAFTNVRAFLDGARFAEAPDRGRRQGPDRDGRPRGQRDAAQGRADHRRGGPDPRPRPVGLPHALRRRFERAHAALAGHHLGARSGQRHRTHQGARGAARQGRSPEPPHLSLHLDRRQGTQHRAGGGGRRPPKPRPSPRFARPRPTACPGSSSTGRSTPGGSPPRPPRRTGSASTSPAISPPACARWTRSQPAMTRSPTSTSR